VISLKEACDRYLEYTTLAGVGLKVRELQEWLRKAMAPQAIVTIEPKRLNQYKNNQPTNDAHTVSYSLDVVGGRDHDKSAKGSQHLQASVWALSPGWHPVLSTRWDPDASVWLTLSVGSAKHQTKVALGPSKLDGFAKQGWEPEPVKLIDGEFELHLWYSVQLWPGALPLPNRP
jgi:hypothetical protein